MRKKPFAHFVLKPGHFWNGKAVCALQRAIKTIKPEKQGAGGLESPRCCALSQSIFGAAEISRTNRNRESFTHSAICSGRNVGLRLRILPSLTSITEHQESPAGSGSHAA